MLILFYYLQEFNKLFHLKEIIERNITGDTRNTFVYTLLCNLCVLYANENNTF